MTTHLYDIVWQHDHAHLAAVRSSLGDAIDTAAEFASLWHRSYSIVYRPTGHVVREVLAHDATAQA